VTSEIRADLEKIRDPAARHDEIEKREKQLIAACEKAKAGLRCNVSSYFRGGMYVLTENLEIRDVRLVYVPARSVGNYAARIDNWRGRATPVTGRSTGRTSARTASPPTTTSTTSRTSRSITSRSPPRASSRATS